MSEPHLAWLSLGSNIEPEQNLRRAVQLLQKHGQIVGISSVWENHAVGINGPDFLNVCVALKTSNPQAEVKPQIIQPIESALGRIRSENKNAPRPIDIDLIMYDDVPVRLEYWGFAYVIVPLAELLPEYEHPVLKQTLAHAAELMRKQVWIQPRTGILPGM